MNDKIDQKITNILADLDTAQNRTIKFHAKEVVPGEKFEPVDIYEMGKTFATRDKLYIELEIARSEKYPDIYPKDKVELLKKERDRLERNIRAYQNRQMPSQYRE